MAKRLRSAKAIYKDLGNRVRIEREAICMTQAQLAKAIGYSRTSVTNLEAGKQAIPLHQIHVIARALMTPPHRLIDGLLYSQGKGESKS